MITEIISLCIASYFFNGCAKKSNPYDNSSRLLKRRETTQNITLKDLVESEDLIQEEDNTYILEKTLSIDEEKTLKIKKGETLKINKKQRWYIPNRSWDLESEDYTDPEKRKKGKLINNGRIIISEGGLITITPHTNPNSQNMFKNRGVHPMGQEAPTCEEACTKSSDAPLENHGTIDNKGTIDSSTNIDNTGTINIKKGGKINILSCRLCAYYTSLGIIRNKGTINNLGMLKLSPYSIINNNKGGIIINKKEIFFEIETNFNNFRGGNLINDGVIKTHALIKNFGVIYNNKEGEIYNMEFKDQVPGTIENHFIILNVGIIKYVWELTGEIEKAKNLYQITPGISIIYNDNSFKIKEGGKYH